VLLDRQLNGPLYGLGLFVQGVMLVKPSRLIFSEMLRAVEADRIHNRISNSSVAAVVLISTVPYGLILTAFGTFGSHDGSDQGFLNSFFTEWSQYTILQSSCDLLLVELQCAQFSHEA
jgi:hypothetical protein